MESESEVTGYQVSVKLSLSFTPVCVSDWLKEWTFPVRWLALSCQVVGRHVCNASPTLLFSPIQLSYKRQRHKDVNTLTTANSTAELTLPEEEDDYIIRIQTLSEGGLGPASDPIRIHQLSKLTRVVVNMLSEVERSRNKWSVLGVWKNQGCADATML